MNFHYFCISNHNRKKKFLDTVFQQKYKKFDLLMNVKLYKDFDLV